MSQGSVLLVEDDADHAAIVGEFLRRHGHTVLNAACGEQALALMGTNPVTIVLLDLQLPDIDGVALLTRIRQRPEPPDVVVLTGHATLESAIVAVEAGAAAYLLKPVNFNRLGALVGRMADQHRLREDNARLAAEEQRRRTEAEHLLAIGRALASVVVLTSTLKEVTRQTARALNASRCAVHLFADEELQPVMAQFADGRADHGLWVRFRGQGIATSVPAYVEAVRTRQAVAIEDARRSPLVPPRWVEAFHLGALLIVPLVVQDAVIGTMTIEAPTPHPWARHEATLATTIAGQLALAISNARLHEEAETQRMSLAQIFESTSDGVMLLFQDGRIACANRGAGALLAFHPETVVGVALVDLLAAHCTTAEDYRRVVEPFEALFGDGRQTGEGDLELPRLRKTLHWRAQVTVNRAGVPVGLTVTWQDVTQQREVARMKSDFVSFVTHQLRTPLAGIKWLLEFTTQPSATADQVKEYVQDARTSTERLIELVNDLLDVSRLEGGRLTVTPRAVSLSELTDSVLGEVSTLVQRKGHRLELAGGAELPPVLADPQLLRQVVLNLISNAVKYTPTEGLIRVRMQSLDGMVQWSVQDTGIGMSPAAQQRLFEKFYRAENATTLETEGTGLGLYLVKLIVERLGGRVWCESEENQGSTFFFTLPVAHASLAADPSPAPAPTR